LCLFFNDNESLTGQIIVWGTLPAKDLDQYFTDYSQINKTFTVEYREIKEVDFIQRFIKSLADDTAPDLILASENVIIPLRQFLQNYDNTQISEAVYKTTFVRASHKLFAENGVVAIPYAVDPLVMYVNTDIMQNANFQRPPTNWSDIPSFVSNLNSFLKNTEQNNQRAIAIGSINNIKEARGILLTLLLQVKNNVLDRTLSYNQNEKIWIEKFIPVFASSKDDEQTESGKAAEQVFTFITSFVNPNITTAYSWSRKYPSDIDLFAAGSLGIYFGLASDKFYIDAKNPHLKYEVAQIPIPKGSEGQIRNTQYVKLYGMSMNQKTLKPILSQKVMNDFTDVKTSSTLIPKFNLAPAQISEIQIPQKDLYREMIYRSADRGDIVLEPKQDLFKALFQEIITSLEGSKVTPSQIMTNAQRELERQLSE
jgi:ABC-type glycerol-3-phosphate transport system substrate-binding protein